MLFGADGTDVIIGGMGADIVSGDTGDDDLDFSAAMCFLAKSSMAVKVLTEYMSWRT